MPKNLVKRHTVADVEACLSKALSDLLGRSTSVLIAGLELKPDPLGEASEALFSVVVKYQPQPACESRV